MNEVISLKIEQRIFIIRGHKVMLDADLAELYGVETKSLNRAVRRNLDRFPKEFMFELTELEWKNLKCQFGASSLEHGGRRKLPLAFSEQGVAMLSSVLNSPRAIQVNIAIIKTFVRLREMIVSNKILAAKLSELEGKIENQGKDIKMLFIAIHELMVPPPSVSKRKIGFHTSI
jgi:hypothetical protein